RCGPGARSGAGELFVLGRVTRRFDAHVAVDGLDLEVRRGEVLGLVGPNGAGKTTTVRMLTGLLPPSAGEVRIAGHSVADAPLEARRHVGYVPDGAPLYPNLSPRQLLLLVGRLHGLEDAHTRTESERLLEHLDLAARIDDPVGTFSRGMRQKTALACAILPKPDLLVLDEPLGGLDAPSASTLKAVLRGWADRGGAVLYTSHLLDVVERVCDRVAVLANARLVSVGPLDSLREEARGAGAGADSTLEDVFGALTDTDDPEARARALLG
ncbi:MAG: ABC transporter ATP-binding protein, partial [Planctomycetota bacterium]